MAKRFKLKICKVISTTLQTCRSKDPSILPQDNPVPSFSSTKISTLHFPPPSNPNLTAAAGSFKWQKDDKFHVISKIHQPRPKIYNDNDNDDDDDNEVTFPSEKNKKRLVKNNKKKKKKKKFTRCRLSSSSAVEDHENETETDTLVNCTTDVENIPARLSKLMKLIPCTVEGKVKESYAIVKRSKDPYEDFKSSMMDMILEKQIFETKDLEQLLQCFLSLNSRHYHGVIVQAFSEIWEHIFFSDS